jgi:hypothetical protein
MVKDDETRGVLQSTQVEVSNQKDTHSEQPVPVKQLKSLSNFAIKSNHHGKCVMLK